MKMRFPSALKVLVRGYLIMAVVIILFMTGLISDIGIIIFVTTVISTSMLFGVGILLMSPDRPVRKSNCNIPNTVLIFVKGALILYFISLIGNFGILSLDITALLMTGMAFALVIFGVVSYVIEVLERASPVTPQTTKEKEIMAMRRRRALVRKMD